MQFQSLIQPETRRRGKHALVLASRAESLIQFQLTYGILVGLAASAFFAPMIAAATAWFENNRSLAVSLVSAGMGVAPMTISPFARWLISTYDWRTAMLVIGILAWSLLLPAALMVRRPPTVATSDARSALAANGAGMSVAQALRSPQFLVLGQTFFACCAAHSGPIFHMVSYAIFCGVPAMAAVSVYSVEGLAGLGGRLLLGVLADRLGAKPVLIAGLMVAGACDRNLCVRRPPRRILRAGRDLRNGLWRCDAALCRAGAGVFRPADHGHGLRRGNDAIEHRDGLWPAGRRLGVRHVRYYTWLFIGSCAVAIGAVAVAVAFPPLQRERLQPA
jgi:hypothetical protein